MSINDIKEYAKINHVPIMKDGGIDFICDYIVKNNVKSILEIGSAIGYSSIRMASLADDIYIDTLEINKDSYLLAIDNIKSNNLDNRINIYNVDALDFNSDKKYDFIFVDAAKAQYKKYMLHFINNSDVFIFDNLEFHGIVDNPSLTNNRNTKSLVRKIRTFRDEMLNSSEYDVTYHKSVGDGVMLVRLHK